MCSVGYTEQSSRAHKRSLDDDFASEKGMLEGTKELTQTEEGRKNVGRNCGGISKNIIRKCITRERERNSSEQRKKR